LSDDSITHDPIRLLISEPLGTPVDTFNGRGVNNTGALRSISGINIYAANIALSAGATAPGLPTAVSIGVDSDSPPGHPSAHNTYFTSDYRLTVTGNISNLPRTTT